MDAVDLGPGFKVQKLVNLLASAYMYRYCGSERDLRSRCCSVLQQQEQHVKHATPAHPAPWSRTCSTSQRKPEEADAAVQAAQRERTQTEMKTERL